MKKLLSCLGICLLSLFAGIFLVSCKEPSSYRISLSQVDELVSVKLEEMPEEKTLLPDENNGWTVAKDAQLRFSISAKELGVVIDDVVVKINGRQKEVYSYNYDMFDREKLAFGWFSLPMAQLKRNIQISITGAVKKTSTFTFNIMDDYTQNEELAQKLQNTYICTDNTDNYIQLYQILQGNKKSYTKEYSSDVANTNPYRTFKMQFRVGEKVINDLYDVSNTNIFSLSTTNSISPVRVIFLEGDHLVVNLGELGGEDSYTISVAFDKLKFTEFNFSYPQDKEAYEISIDKEKISYNQGATLTFTKKNKEKYDYSNLTIKIGNITLEIQEGTIQDDEIKFTIPQNITPMMAEIANYLFGNLIISVDGIESIAGE